MKKILVIEDNAEVRENLEEILELSGYEVLTAEDGKLGVEIALKEMPDLVLCDVMMPRLDGFGVLNILSKKSSTADIPFVFLTAKTEKSDFRRGMNLGADDYLPKPCNPRELAARLRAILRRAQTASDDAASGALAAGQIRIDPAQRSATYSGIDLQLTSAEFNVLQVLLSGAGTVVDKETLCKQALGRALSAYDRSIDVHISKIRKKLAFHGGNKLIVSVRGNGYQLRMGTGDD